MNNSLSTITEIYARGAIHEIHPSVIRSGVFIVLFKMGDQANIDTETYYKLLTI